MADVPFGSLRSQPSESVRLVLAAAMSIAASLVVHAQRPGPPGPPPLLPLTQLDDRGATAELDRRIVSLTVSEPTAIRDVLLRLLRDTSLSVVLEPTLAGTFVGGLKNVTVRQALNLILPPLGLDFTVDGAFVRVLAEEPETRLFEVAYLATSRSGASSVGVGPPGGEASHARVASSSSTDAVGELAAGVRALVSERGTFNVDRRAGLVQVTDLPDRLDRIGVYLDAVRRRVRRQVQIDVRLVEVELTGDTVRALDWSTLVPTPSSSQSSTANSGGTSRVTDVQAFLAALATQGRVSVLGSPRLVTLNNEPALVRVASHASTKPGDETANEPADTAITLSVTPRVDDDGDVTMAFTPIVEVADRGPAGRSMRIVREGDVTTRVRRGESLVMSALATDRELTSVERRGRFGRRSSVVTRARVELVLLVTPSVMDGL